MTPHTQEIAYYQRIIQKMPEFTPFRINAHIRLGKLYTETGKNDAAIREYAAAAAQYAHNGALVKALAVNTLILDLDASQKDVLAEMSALYFKQRKRSVPLLGECEGELSADALELTLAQVPLFSDLTAEERKHIAAYLVPQHFEQGATILQEGDFGDCMYLIQAGQVDVYTMLMEKERGRDNADQEMLLLATLKAGDFFGEQALITNDPRNATIQANTAACLLSFSKRDLASIIQTYPHVGDVLETYHQRRNSQTIASLKSALQNMRG